ncbi:hypothetical protein QF035_007313 [Streptomyces umbrinus]|uniref:Uncharacterized protein n=1 Tax=Streptomyces umbrinus TaxID=67370 RepID=A0ABU0T1R6_9ACTN|nr:DUF6183 family protein [Streptomyces umbrinus]MDQ1029731.1 hypothetical protein [Streptomyces umbrinus]
MSPSRITTSTTLVSRPLQRAVGGGGPFPEAVRRASDHRWLRFMAFTDWFHHDTADVAFAVLDPSRTRVAVLAATDTDADAHF